MVTLVIVLVFPAIVFAGFGVAYAMPRVRPHLLTGATGFALYCALLAVPLAAVVLDAPDQLRGWFEIAPLTPAWVAAGVALGLALWGAQRLTARPTPAEPGVWVGPPGRTGYAVLMLPVAYVVVAEEVVWRGYLTPAIGLPLASAAFALHHYHFGWRHVVFACAAGLLWGALFLLEGHLYGCIASHLTYNALAWAWLRRQRNA